MTINGQGYRETFLRCITEGYDAAYEVVNDGGDLKNPYDEYSSHYEHEAWESGKWWYLSNVH